MNLEARALAALAARLDAAGFGAPVRDGAIPFAPMGLDFRVAHVDVTHHPQGAVLARVLFDAGAAGDAREGIIVNAVGIAMDEAAALASAADQWIEGVFPVLHRWLSGRDHDLGVETTELTVDDVARGTRHGWRVHLGAVLVRGFGVALQEDALPGQQAIVTALREPIAARAAAGALFWVEAYVGRVPGQAPQSTCRLRNEEWVQAEARLIAWAGADGVPEGMGIRQFLLFEPIAAG